MTDSVESAAADYTPPPPATAAPMQARVVRLASVVTHPANPRKDLGDLTEMEESIRELGVLQPPVVLPAARVAAAWPEHVDELADAEWVVLMGARRRTAAGNVAAGDPDAELPVLVRDDDIADDPAGQLDVMTAENVARAPLTAVEEARAFAAQVQAGRGQRAIAARMGCSQGHVSKRLKLLQLPATLLDQVEQGDLQIKDALAFVDAADGDQEVMLAAYRLRDDRRQHWSAAQLVAEVRRERERRDKVDTVKKDLAADGVPLILSAEKRFGNGYWERRLDGAKAIAKARKDGALVAEVDAWGHVTYYSTTGKPKKADNRSPVEQQRITDERERRKAMTARAEAAAMLAARPPKLPKTAGDIIDAWLWAPGNECAQLAHRWLLAAGVGPDPALPNHQWWEQVRRADWPTRVHAAHALGIARREVQARATYRTWTADDAAWLARLIEEAGYTPSAWEQARLDTIDPEPGDAADRADAGRQVESPERAVLVFDAEDACCWVLYLDDADKPTAWAEHLPETAGTEALHRWAEEQVAGGCSAAVSGWEFDPHHARGPAHVATLTSAPTGEATGGAPADQVAVGEYRLLHDPVDDAWLLLADNRPHADHDGLDATEVDQACQWATGVLTDAGVVCHGWTARADGSAALEYVADLTGQC
jgi:ParB/RepB/Spo0J family partition protein